MKKKKGNGRQSKSTKRSTGVARLASKNLGIVVDPATGASARTAIVATKPSEPKLSSFRIGLDAISPHLDGASIATLSKTRVRSLAKHTALPESDIAALVSAHKLASDTGLSPDILFALNKNGGARDTESLTSYSPSILRKKIKSAVKKNIVPSTTLAALERARPILARLQTREVPIKTLVDTYDLEVSSSLLRKLEAKKIQTLADVRSAGGTEALAKALKVKSDDPSLENVVSHAHLSLLGTDVGSNETLIKHGYDRIAKIADAPDGVFIKQVGPAVGAAMAMRMKKVATAQREVLKNQVTDLMVNQANGFKQVILWDLANPNITIDRCGCEDCSSAVSPLAYLADLMGYATAKLGTQKGDPTSAYELLTPHGLEERFLQPFNSLPTSCSLMSEQLRQVRICIEVLRAYCKSQNIALPQTFRDREAQYRRDTYQALLLKLGTSYAALRASRGASQEDREALATGLGIPVGDGGQRDYLGELLLDADTVTESDLERLFGLVDTTRDVLSHGAKFSDARDQIKRWNFSEVSWNVNTDIDGCVFVSLTRAGGKTQAQVYRAAGTTNAAFPEATAEVEGPANGQQLLLKPYDVLWFNNKLAGELEVDYVAAASNIKFQVVPQFVSWRLQTLRRQWQEQDRITDVYSASTAAAERLPIVDPDLIGPDDFRDPFGAKGTPFQKFWQARRAWVDDTVNDLSTAVFSATAAPAASNVFTTLFQEMQQTSYAGASKTLWPETAESRLRKLSTTLQDKNNKDVVVAAVNNLWSTFKLTPQMLARLMALKNKHEDWVYDPLKNSPLEQEEWGEVVNILVQAHKVAWYSDWMNEEAGQKLLLGPRDFWISLREPKEGSWSPDPVADGGPRIDPEILKFDELPEETVGARAILLWNTRQDELQAFAHRLAGFSRDMLGATNRIKETFADLDIADLEQQYDNLRGANGAARVQALQYVQTTLKWSEEPFNSVMELRGRLRAGQNPPPPKPTEAEWVEMERLLTAAYRRYRLWKVWKKEEDDAGLKYWNMVKARLPRWRASVEARLAWRQALQAHSAPANVDPDLLRATHFRFRIGNPAEYIWKKRAANLPDFRPTSKTKIGLETLLKNTVGPFATDGLPPEQQGWAVLVRGAKERNIAAARLDQLGISRHALDYLVRMHELLAQTPPQRLTDAEWDDIAAILTQVWKMRQTAEWREEERIAEVTFSPDFFKIPEFASTTQFPPPRAPDPPRWRGTRGDVQDLEDRLQSRIDQEKAVIDGVRQAVSEVEELTLPALRDALVTVCGKGKRNDIGAKADGITQLLLIDAKQSGCEKTTRISQAIATLQQLLWGVRTGLLADTHPDIKLIPRKESAEAAIQEFDEALTWIGSYASWRAAMFVFLNPEIIMLPSLKRNQTPAFRQAVEDFRGPRLSAARFSAAVKRYYEYFNDVCDLAPPLCHSTSSNVYEENEQGLDIAGVPVPRLVEYLFARTSRGVLYWSVANTADPDWGQTYWRKLKGFKNDLVGLVGCAVYKTSAQRRFLYLFAKTARDGVDKLEFLRLDLERGGWDADASEIVIDEAREQKSFTVLLQPRGGTAQDESVPISLLFTYPDRPEYLYTLGQRGDTDQSTAQEIGTTTNWTGRIDTDLSNRPTGERNISFVASGNYWHEYVSGTSLCVWNAQGTTRLLLYWAKHDSRVHAGGNDANYPHAQYMQGSTKPFCLAGTVANGAITWGNVVNVTPDTYPHTQSQDIHHTWTIGYAVADLNGDGIPDLIWCHLKKISTDPQNKIYSVYYKVGWRVGNDGHLDPPHFMTQEFSAGISFNDPIMGLVKNKPNSGTDHTQNGLKVAIASPPGSNRNYLVVIGTTFTSNGDVNPFRMFTIEIGSDGAAIGSASEMAGPISTIDGTPTGVGLTFTSLRNNNQLDAIVFYLMRPKTDGGVVGEYFVNTNWSPTTPQETWSPAQKVGGEVDTWFGVFTGGGAIVATDLNGNGRQDLIVFHDGYGNGTGPVDGFYRVGYDIGFDPKRPGQACVYDNFKPLSGSVPTEVSGFRPMRLTLGDAFQRTKRQRNFVYLEEANHFFLVLAALKLQQMQEFVAALEWFRLTYDYTLPSERRLLIGLAARKTNAKEFVRDDPAVKGDEYDWLLDPLNPHSIAQTRPNTYVRYTLLSIIRCLLEYAEAEFTIDNPESLPRARELFMTVLALLYENELKPVSETCEGVRGDLEILFGDKWADYLPELLPTDLGSIEHARHFRDHLTKVFKRYREAPNPLEKMRAAMTQFSPPSVPQRRLGSVLTGMGAEALEFEAAAIGNEHLVNRLENLAMRFTVVNVQGATGPSVDPVPPDGDDVQVPTGSFGDFGVPDDKLETIPFEGSNPEMANSEPPVVDRSGWLRVSRAFCVPQNPVLRALRLRANLNLYKIRTCRNISGLKRELDPYAAPTDTMTGLPSIGAGGQLVLPGATSLRPTAYRYQALIERAKQLVQLAMQIEQARLSAIEKTEAEEYALLKAKQDLNLSRAGVRLQELRVTEAQGGIRLAALQRDRAEIQIDTLTEWLSAGLSQLEEALIGLYIASGITQATAGIADAVLQGLQASSGTGMVAGGPAAAAVSGAARGATAALEASIRVLQVYESQERRVQQLQLESALAAQDYAIGAQQVDLAEDHVRVTEQERTIAQMEDENVREVVDFLTGKFTNKELYDWMSSVLERVYGYFLQQATSTAQLAQAQLAFERQETPPAYIQPDYWEARTSTGTSSTATDRRGLTGSARLLQDIYQLDQYAFDTNKRKLQLTKTISLAQLAPFEFQRFRETGILNFATPMELFDRDFPGHYLRLIKRVRTSVIALIPPSQGIRATLSSTGLSRVVIAGDIFQTINLRRNPETIALSSPINATGLFDLESQEQTEMSLPLEGSGVDIRGEFRMPKSSNQFDYDTIADVLLTLEYTALNSFDYYQQVIQSPALNRPLSADRPYSFRRDFADAWYDLHNPDQSSDPMVVRFETTRDHFPPNLSNIRIQHVMWYVASTTENRIDMEGVQLRFTEQGGGTVGGPASTNEGVISTRRGNAGPWNAMIGKAPFGHWELRLPKAVRELFSESAGYPQKPADRVAEILLVITYSGRTPQWPP